MTIYRDADADLALIQAKKVAVIGYGNQGRAQALNLRDSGVHDIRVALQPGSTRIVQARTDGFQVFAPAEAAVWADVVAILIPDEYQGDLYTQELHDRLKPGAALIFAHGLAIRFDLIVPRADLDILLVAPKGPGTALRDDYLAGSGLITLFAAHQNASGQARALALSYAAALGGGRKGMIETTFAEECEADLFNEQAVLWGAIPELILAGYDTLTEAGFSPEIAYFECLTEVKLLADLLVARGIAGMREAISNTAEYGAMTGGLRIVNDGTRAEMRRILAEVQDGGFARALVAEAKAGYPRLKAARAASARHPLEKIAETMRALDNR
ncbi:ketol-acid reductoisomerase [Allosphingosinicella flava]|uniref:Ketol-acid reductoisomerase (NADP(+)) n=1 Tax=Allosphingosinicella flava TaxID=2771430 RepID=A0A7T2LMS5_9SPHN|nr:ketol-acid reductoisomerase [Sphingosinicella flava]QPQ55884.1 ketol-acid reductoisomerase [Sphingosinicella flava]